VFDRTNGLVLHQGAGFDGQDVVVVATGFTTPSTNPKTGEMLQVWVLPATWPPGEAVRLGRDGTTCGDCKFAGGKGCYVRAAHSPSQVWEAWRNGSYHRWDGNLAAFGGKDVRWGAYGEPVLIPLWIVASVSAVARGTTGYTHAWRGNPDYREFLMASVDSPREREEALRLGWRTYRVRGEGTPLLQGEFSCPSSTEEGHRLSCVECMACDGAGRNPHRASPSIFVHGSKRGRMVLPLA
jgi:hypothetical protein